MSVDVVRVWKDPIYRQAVGHAACPSPVGEAYLNNEQLGAAEDLPIITTAITCTEFTWNGWRACCY